MSLTAQPELATANAVPDKDSEATDNDEEKDEEKDEEPKAKLHVPEMDWREWADFQVSSVSWTSVTTRNSRTQTTKIKYAKFEDEWYSMPKVGDYIGTLNNPIETRLKMVGRVVDRQYKTDDSNKTQSKKRKQSPRRLLDDVIFIVEILGVSPHGLSPFDDGTWKREYELSPDQKTIILPFRSMVCRVSHKGHDSS